MGFSALTSCTFSALVVGEFLSHFGPRATGGLGAILVSSGYIGASYSNSIAALCTSLGFIAGKVEL